MLPEESPLLVFSRKRPKYEQVVDYLNDQIREGHCPVGGKLPSARDLSSTLGVSVATTFRAIQELARAGVVESYVGAKGTIVVRREPISEAKPTTLACLLRGHRARNDEDNFAVDMIQGVRDEISAHHYRFVYHCLDERDYDRRMLRLAREDWTCGILVDQATPTETIRQMLKTGMPTIIMNRQLALPGLNCVVPDYERIARESGRMFFEKGYERVGFASIEFGESNWSESQKNSAYPTMAMRRGLRATALARGLCEDDIVWIAEHSAPVQSTPEFFGLPRRKPEDWRPLGVLADTDKRAVALIEAVRQTDLILGKDIGVIGCYDLPAGRHSTIPPSTWRIDPLAIGAGAVSQLIGCVESHEAQAAFVKISVEFVDRGTA
jgi:DNA-binding LacI/PurR family transcriptional regulator